MFVAPNPELLMKLASVWMRATFVPTAPLPILKLTVLAVTAAPPVRVKLLPVNELKVT